MGNTIHEVFSLSPPTLFECIKKPIFFGFKPIRTENEELDAAETPDIRKSEWVTFEVEQDFFLKTGIVGIFLNKWLC